MDEVMGEFNLNKVSLITKPNLYPMIEGVETISIPFNILQKRKPYPMKRRMERSIKTYRADLVEVWDVAKRKMNVLLGRVREMKKMDYNNAATIDRIAKIPFRYKKQFVEIANKYDLNLGILDAIVLNNTLMVNARYDNKENLIEFNPDYLKQHGQIRIGDSGEWISETAKTLIHEFGHATYYNTLSEEERTTWQSLATFLQRKQLTGDMNQYIVGEKKRFDGSVMYSPYYTLKDESFVSVYARFNIREDFAECFLYFKVAPHTLERVNPKKSAFIQAKIEGRIEKGGEGSGRYPKGSGKEEQGSGDIKHPWREGERPKVMGNSFIIDSKGKIHNADSALSHIDYIRKHPDDFNVSIPKELKDTTDWTTEQLNKIKDDSTKAGNIHVSKLGDGLYVQASQFDDSTIDRVMTFMADSGFKPNNITYSSDNKSGLITLEEFAHGKFGKSFVSMEMEKTYKLPTFDFKKLKLEKDKVMEELKTSLKDTAVGPFKEGFVHGKNKGAYVLREEASQKISTKQRTEYIEPLLERNAGYIDGLIEDVSDEYDELLFRQDPYGNVEGMREWEDEMEFDQNISDVMDTQEHRLGHFAENGLLTASIAGLIFMTSEKRKPSDEEPEPDRPLKEEGETADEFQSRIDEWETAVRERQALSTLEIETEFAGGIWHTMEDEKVCDECNSLDGQWVSYDELASLYGMGAAGTFYPHPSIHPRCRCAYLFEPAPAPEQGELVEAMQRRAVSESRIEKNGQNAYAESGIVGVTVTETVPKPKRPEKVIACDYHGTIVKDNKIVPEMKAKLIDFKAQGFKIIIYSSGFNNNPGVVNGIEVLLRENDIPFDEVWQRNGKPDADLYIDDKSFNPNDKDIETLQITPEGKIKEDKIKEQ